MLVTWTRPTVNGFPAGGYFAHIGNSSTFAAVSECTGARRGQWSVQLFPKGRRKALKTAYVSSLIKAQLWVTRYAQAHWLLCGGEAQQAEFKDIYGRPGYNLLPTRGKGT